MSLSAPQLALLKATIIADPVLVAQVSGSDGAYAIAALLNLPASPDFFVWATDVPVQAVYDQIQWAKLTPADAVPTSDALAVAIWQARSLACQGKQFNLQTMLMGQLTINAANTSVRAGLQDALTNVPSAVAGATQSAGWVGVRDVALARKATRFEKLFANTAGGNGSTAALSATMVLEGNVSWQNVESARQS